MTGAIQAASIGIPDTLFIMLLALVVFGPRRLPEIGRQIGKLMYEFRKASNEFKYQMEEEMRKAEEAEHRLKLDLENRKLYPALGAPTATDAATTPYPDPEATGTENSIAKPVEEAESTSPVIQPPSTGESVLRGKTMSQLTADAEALAEQTRTAIADRAAIAAQANAAPAKAKAPRKPRAPKKSASSTESSATPAAAPVTPETDEAVKNG